MVIYINFFLVFILLILAPNPGFSSGPYDLQPCISTTNCKLIELKAENSEKSFEKLVQIASGLPRTFCISKHHQYWHGFVESKIFKFKDDLEINNVPSMNIVQIKSRSRVGIFDLGVNKKRLEFILYKFRQE